MIINYLRGFDGDQYLKLSGNLLKKEKTRFHIKYLILTLLAYRNNPSTNEIAFADKYILNNPKFKTIFLQVAIPIPLLFF